MDTRKMENDMKSLATGRTTYDVSRGSSDTIYSLEVRRFEKKIVDAAKNQQYFMQACLQLATQGTEKQVSVPIRKYYLGDTGVSYTTSTPAVGTAITMTGIDNADEVIFTPSPQASGVSIGNYALRTNSVVNMTYAREELTEAIGRKLDKYIGTVIGDAASTTSSTSGMQTLYGGDATSDATLSPGDVITTDLVAKALRLLADRNKQYRASTGAGGGYGAVSGTVVGNEWEHTNDEPFILYIGPAQKEAFLTDSQFVNASEFGGNGPVLNGEIPTYLGCRIVVTNNVERVASGAEGPDAETANAGATMTRCILLKAKKAVGFCWGLKPTIKMDSLAREISQDIVMECDYVAMVLHADAIVAIDVADA